MLQECDEFSVEGFRVCLVEVEHESVLLAGVHGLLCLLEVHLDALGLVQENRVDLEGGDSLFAALNGGREVLLVYFPE